MNGISKKAHVAAIGLGAIVAIAQGDSDTLAYYAFVCITVITVVAVVLQAFLDRNNHKGAPPDDKSKKSLKEIVQPSKN